MLVSRVYNSMEEKERKVDAGIVEECGVTPD